MDRVNPRFVTPLLFYRFYRVKIATMVVDGRSGDPMIRILKLTGCVLAGTLLYLYGLSFIMQTGWALSAKFRGQADSCPWYRVFRFEPDLQRFGDLYDEAKTSIAVVKNDGGLRQVSYRGAPFWIRDDALPAESIGYLFAEHAWLGETNETEVVQADDVVLDIGAHVGVFATQALERGAAIVVVVEPDPLNVACLRRNFAKQIESSRC